LPTTIGEIALRKVGHADPSGRHTRLTSCAITLNSRARLRAIPFLAVVLAIAAPLAAQTTRLRGIIDKDQTWTGHILITDDLTIQLATVTVAPGTVIEFAAADPGRNPCLTVGTPTSPGTIEWKATPDQPIVVRSRADARPGCIVVYVTGRRTETAAPADPGADNDARSREPVRFLPDDVAWRHVRFERMGYSRAGPGGRDAPAQITHPAVLVQLRRAAHTFGLSHCTFRDCTRVQFEVADGATVNVLDTTFDATQERVALELIGDPTIGDDAAHVARNRADAAIHFSAIMATLLENVLIGPFAAVVVQDQPEPRTRIAGNFIHNTTTDDDGRYALSCENPDAVIEDNIIRGGSNCVLVGSRRMHGNVFIGAPRLKSPYVKSARTHQLVQALLPGATFERNILIGPAYTLLVPHPPMGEDAAPAANEPTRIRHNVFDGMERTSRAIQLSPIGRSALTVSIDHNLFLRGSVLACSESQSEDRKTLVHWDYNAICPPTDRAFERLTVADKNRGDPGFGKCDLTIETLAALGLAAPPMADVPDVDDELQSGRVTIAQVRKRFFDAYRPLPHSPLVRAGRREVTADGKNVTPSIGATEPRTD
jgi:hypothetical protein